MTAEASSKFFELDATAWTGITAIATAALFLAAVITAAIAVRQLRSTVATWRDEARAYVIVEFTSTLASEHLIDFAVRNAGRTPAFDVTISWDPRPQEANPRPNFEFAQARMFREPIAMLAPGREYRLYFDSHVDRHGRHNVPSLYAVTVKYRDRWGKWYTEEYLLDVNSREGGRFIGVKNLHDLAKSVEAIANTVTRSSLFGGQFEVITESRQQATAREVATYDQVARRDGLAPLRRATPAKRRGTRLS
jgi:hypothetical protein